MTKSIYQLMTALACGAAYIASPARADVARLLDVRKIWDAAPYNSFTDLIRYNDAFYTAFREGTIHGVPPAGQPGGDLRILRSTDGINWASAALITGGINRDLRDAKLAVTPDNRLMLEGAMAPNTAPGERQSLVWFSNDGTSWSDASNIGDHNYWLWGVHWNEGQAYSIGYGPTTGSLSNLTTRLYRSTDGTNFQTSIPTFTPQGGTSEGTILFRDNSTAVSIVRRDAFSQLAVVGTSSGDFTNWNWKDANVRFEGPELLELPDGRIVAAGRRVDGAARTSLNWLDPSTGVLTEFLALSSGGDNSYAGMVWHDDRLWVSYYSSHEGKPSIYMAQVGFVDPFPIRHSGDTNPTGEGWIPQVGGVQIAVNGGIIDGGVHAWSIRDTSSVSGSREAWTQSLAAEQLSSAVQGWRMKSRVQVLGNSDSPDGAIELSVFLNSNKGFVLWLGSDAAGNATASEFKGSSSTAGLGRTATINGSGYHDFEMSFDPATQAVDVFADGALIIDNMLPRDLGGTVLNRVLWGSNASAGIGSANYAYIDFQVGTPVPGDYNGDQVVDDDDYAEWRASYGSTANPAADGTGNKVIDAADYVIWRSSRGNGDAPSGDSAMVPEPAAVQLILAVACCCRTISGVVRPCP